LFLIFLTFYLSSEINSVRGETKRTLKQYCTAVSRTWDKIVCCCPAVSAALPAFLTAKEVWVLIKEDLARECNYNFSPHPFLGISW